VAGAVYGSLYMALEEDLSMVAARCRRLGIDMLMTADEADAGQARELLILDSLQLSARGVVEQPGRRYGTHGIAGSPSSWSVTRQRQGSTPGRD
jgi:hypothetical protein